MSCNNNDPPINKPEVTPLVAVSCTPKEDQSIEFFDPASHRNLKAYFKNDRAFLDEESVVILLQVEVDKLYDDELKKYNLTLSKNACSDLEKEIKEAYATRDQEKEKWEAVKKKSLAFIGSFKWSGNMSQSNQATFIWSSETEEAFAKQIKSEGLCFDKPLTRINIRKGTIQADLTKLLTPLVLETFKLTSFQQEIENSTFESSLVEYCDLISGKIWAHVEVDDDTRAWKNQRADITFNPKNYPAPPEEAKPVELLTFPESY